MLQARTNALIARTTGIAQRSAEAEDVLNRIPARNNKIPLVKDVTDRALLGIHEAIPQGRVSSRDHHLVRVRS